MHRLEWHILGSLIRAEELRYSQLKPKQVEGNVFMYHLKVLIKAGLVYKTISGSYQLTSHGMLLADKMQLDTLEIIPSPRTVILIACRRQEDGAWLLHKRKVQPLINQTGFLHTNPVLGESITKTAQNTLEQVNGVITENLRVRGAGYITVSKDNQPESFISFQLVEATAIGGKLVEETELGQNSWVNQPNFRGSGYILSMAAIVSLLESTPIDQLFYAELEYDE